MTTPKSNLGGAAATKGRMSHTVELTDAQRKRLDEIQRKSPKLYGIFRRVYEASRPSRRDVLKAKCLDCCCYQIIEAKLCGSTSCPLWRVNPYLKHKTGK